MTARGDDNQIELRSATNTCNRGQRVDLSRWIRAGCRPWSRAAVRAARGGSGRRSSPARDSARVQPVEPVAGDARHPGGRHRRARVHRLQRLRRRLRARAARPGRLLPARLLEHQHRPGRQVPPHSGARRRRSTADLRIEARDGYYANRSFANTNRRDREAQLDDQLAAAVSSTDVPMVVGTGWFRQAGTTASTSRSRWSCPARRSGPGRRRNDGDARRPRRGARRAGPDVVGRKATRSKVPVRRRRDARRPAGLLSDRA